STGLRVLRAAQVLSRVEAALRQAERAFERRRQLVDKGIMSRAALDTAKTNLETAKARVGEAQSSLRLAERDDTNRDIVSPVSGKVASQDVEPGELVQPGTVIARIQAAQIVRIVTYLSERDIGLIKAGGPAQVRVPAVPGQAFSARVESVGIQADEATGNFPVKLVVENADGLLRAGMTARVRFQDIVLPDQLVLPQRALINRNLRRVVFVVANGKAVRREPVLRAGFSDKLVVISGLEPGETVIVEGHDAVVDGTLVSISDEASK
ncbi:MAG: efflux RND transporter periplasmic adaptor subunit, partial [Methyloligellaceae bacterium]